MVGLVLVSLFELSRRWVMFGTAVEGVVRSWALVSGLQWGDVALDGRSGAVRRF